MSLRLVASNGAPVLSCTVCGKPGEPVPAVRPDFHEDHEAQKTHIALVGAPSPGVACSAECCRLLFFRFDDDVNSRRLEQWLWRARRAESYGQSFDEPPPPSALEDA